MCSCIRFFLPAVLALVVSDLLALFCMGGGTLSVAFSVPFRVPQSPPCAFQSNPDLAQIRCVFCCVEWCIVAFQVCRPFCWSFLPLVIFVLLTLFS